jgi:hypothetical protein
VVLLEAADAEAGPDDDLAARGPLDAGQHAEERGLAGAVRADQAVAAAGRELRVDVLRKLRAPKQRVSLQVAIMGPGV